MIIALASSKGGVGKSTTTVCLAGTNKHIVDLDPNGTASRWIGNGKLTDKKIAVSRPDPSHLLEHLKNLEATSDPEVILLDVAGSFESF